MLYQKKLIIEISIFLVALLIIFIRWFYVFNKEASAPPIVVDKTTPKKEKEKYLS